VKPRSACKVASPPQIVISLRGRVGKRKGRKEPVTSVKPRSACKVASLPQIVISLRGRVGKRKGRKEPVTSVKPRSACKVASPPQIVISLLQQEQVKVLTMLKTFMTLYKCHMTTRVMLKCCHLLAFHLKRDIHNYTYSLLL